MNLPTRAQWQHLASARLAAVQVMPYFGTALAALVVRPAPGLGTMGVTPRGVLMVDFAWTETLDVKELAGVLLHETQHPMRHHADRCNGRDHREWNLAGDLEIDDDLRLAGVVLPADGMWPSKFNLPDGFTAEEYHRLLFPPQPPPPPQGGAGGQPDPKGSEGDPGPGQNHPGDPGGVCRGRCGGAAGNALPGEEDADAEDGRSEADMASVHRATAEAIRSAQASGKLAGKVPAGLVRMAEEILGPPVIPWRSKLRRAVRTAVTFRMGAVVSTYLKPSRRQSGVGNGPGAPRLTAYRAPVPRVAVAVDTSGSMSAHNLGEGMREIRGVLRALGTPVRFLTCDADTHGVTTVTRAEDVRMVGGGGTSFVPIFEALAKERDRVDIIIVITDGFGPAPESPPPGTTVIWALVGGGRPPATWGECVQVTP